MLAGRMMDFPLTLTHFLERARTYYPRSEIVSRNPDKSLHRYTFADFYKRTCRLMNALTRLGVKPGDRVATLSWNHYRHLEVYYGAPAMGAVVHTLNLRLHPTDLGYIARHAEDSVLVVDRSLLPLYEKFAAAVPSIRHVIVIPDAGPAPEGKLDYEQLLAAESEEFALPKLDEQTAAMLCYTSGTTGNPKGVLYSHRSIVLHTLACCLPDATGMREADTVLPVVPMFHAAAWGLAFDAILTGAKLVFPGPHLDPQSLLDLMAAEKVTVAGGVPTIWLGILALMDQEPKKWDLSRVRSMLIGGSAAPPSLIDGFKQRHGLEVVHAWGMTELSPVGTMAKLKGELRDAAQEAQLAARASQGFALPFVETRVVADDGRILPWDGKTMGELEVRGPWVAGSYYGGEGPDRFTGDGWFKTGDVVTIDKDGYVRICDRAKEVIKSGGEWISSVALENALMAHPAVLEAAVFAGKHVKWDERPLAAVVLKPGQTATKQELAAHLEKQFAKFWMPDDYLFIPQIPRNSTGKFLKAKLREEFGDHLLKNPTASSAG
ncbi:long-chain fatty acid--CoA ligase [Pyxidicoccus sp. 3LG]